MKPVTKQIFLFILTVLAFMVLGCSSKEAFSEKGEQPVDVKYVTAMNADLVEQNTQMEDEIACFTLAEKIQGIYSNQGISKSFRMVHQTVKQAFDIASAYEIDLPDGMRAETFAYYLLAFASKESDFNPMIVGKAGDGGICQTLKKDYPRLVRKARRRGLDFKDDITSIRTGLICCAEEFIEKLRLTHGNINEAVWKYNGKKEYYKEWKARYNRIVKD